MNIDFTKVIDKLIGYLPADLQQKAKESRKAIIAGIGSLLTVLTMVSGRFGFLLPEKLRKPLSTVISILTAVLTYATPNETPSVATTSASSGLSATPKPVVTP